MATLKIATLNLNGNLRDRNVFTVKLDAWKQTFYYWTFDNRDELLLDGFNLGDLSHGLVPGVVRTDANGPLVLEFGGAFYKGKPIQLDDTITFQCNKQGPESNCRLLCVKQYFVEDRPGPDRLITEQLAREVVKPRRATPARPTTPRPTTTPARPTFTRPVRRDTFSK